MFKLSRIQNRIFAGLILLVFCGTGALPAAPAPGFAPGKFIPTFAICYSNAKGARSTEETARFDMLVCSAGQRTAGVWGRNGRNSWEALKALNAEMVLAVYVMGPGEYNTAGWGQMGEGWAWLKREHGKGAADRWITLGRKSGGYLQAVPYPN